MKRGSYYKVVRDFILQRIDSGEYKPGDKLPSERCFVEDLSLNRNTVRHALLLLQREGQLFRLERKGWYICPKRLVYNPANHVNFARLAESQGMHASWTTEDNGQLAAADVPDLCEEGFAEDDAVYEMVNTFFLNDQKVAYTVTYLDAEKLLGIVPKTFSRAMTQVVEEEYGLSFIQRKLIIRPMLLPKEVTDVLNVSHGSPGVYIRRTKTDEAGQVLTVEHEYWRFDAIELRVDSSLF